MPVCDTCGKQFGGDVNTHKSGKACKKAALLKVKVEVQEDNRKWRIVSTYAETVVGERIYNLEAWFWDGCPVRFTELWHVLDSGTSIRALEEIAIKEVGLLKSNKV